MKRTVLLIFSFFVLAGNARPQKTFIIHGQLEGVEEGTHISLIKEEGSVGTEVIKDRVVNGRFHIEYTPDNEEMGRYLIRSFDKGFPSTGLNLWAKPGHNITIKGENKFPYTWDVISDIPEQKEWSYFVQANKLLWNNYQQLSALRSVLRSSEPGPGADPERKKALDSLARLSDTFLYKIYERNLTLLQKGSMTPVRLKILDAVANMIKWNHTEAFRAPVTKIYNGLDASLKNSAYGENIANVLYPPKVVKVGEPMYDTVLTDLNGKFYRLADFKGKYILLDFWSFGCGPCHASVPEMKEIAEKLKDSLVIVSLSSDNKKMWKQASEYFKMTWNNFSDGKENRGIYAKYGVEGIPNYVLITPNSMIKGIWTGYAAGSLKSKIKELTNFSVD